jgi:hypothetical protein
VIGTGRFGHPVYFLLAAMTQSITLHSHWRGKQTPVEVVVTRVSVRDVSYMAADCSVSGTLPQCSFPELPAHAQAAEEVAQNRMNTAELPSSRRPDGSYFVTAVTAPPAGRPRFSWVFSEKSRRLRV